jgi:hypothetical protein
MVLPASTCLTRLRYDQINLRWSWNALRQAIDDVVGEITIVALSGGVPCPVTMSLAGQSSGVDRQRYDSQLMQPLTLNHKFLALLEILSYRLTHRVFDTHVIMLKLETPVIANPSEISQ